MSRIGEAVCLDCGWSGDFDGAEGSDQRRCPECGSDDGVVAERSLPDGYEFDGDEEEDE